MELEVGMLVMRMYGWMDVGCDEMMLTHSDVGEELEKLDIRSSPLVVLMGIVFGAAKVSIQNRSKIASQYPPECCIVVELAVALS